MNIETRLLNALKAEQARYALEALKTPGDKSAFDFGARVGTISGLEKAINLLMTIVDDAKNGDNVL